MNAYHTYDAIDDQRWVDLQLKEEREAWIENRAQEIITALPDSPALLSLFLPADIALAFYGDKAQEAFNDFISACAYFRAEEEWQRQSHCQF